ncbi:YitT family ABC transporter [Spiroplasma culicicola]|uniref:YitT family protein n=1 Tax=Spiroplasma culicicola AES-1 TaxID=1276246 RepID=W6A747_9MOLU|nr:YitT family ABC transporter [Spiroplasma culicicola]AHI52812.1 hypothetical protein SCULI_v1c04710 [Spiroplasma culicicola AES-1]
MDTKENITIEDLEIHQEEFRSKEEEKEIKKAAKELLKHEGQIDLSHIENKVISKREQILLVQSYFRTKFLRDLTAIMLAALINTIAFDYFISATGRTGLFPAGIGALARFFSVLTFPDSIASQGSFYFIYYFAINAPLFIFGYLKLGKKFTFTTILYILLQIAFDQTLQLMPFINPASFHLIVNYQLLQSISNSWNTGIWLFIFGSLGGILVGWSYSFVYKVGSSTGGLDFLTVYISKKSSKPIGTLNRNVNFVILAVVITLNTAVLPVEYINPDIKINAFTSLSDSQASGLLNDMITHAIKHGAIDVENNVIDPVFAYNMGLGDLIGNSKNIDLKEAIFEQFGGENNLAVNGSNRAYYEYLVEYVSKTGFGKDVTLPTNVLIRLKFMFIFGPSLFASIALVLCSGLITNALYPKYKVRTYLITTNNPKEINKLLLNKGFQNDIVSWDGTNRINHNYLHRSIIMVAMSVMDWDELERDVFMVDPQVKINILKTKAVKGIFNYEIKKNDDRDIIHRKVTTDDSELEKIRQIAIVKFNKENERLNKKQQRKQFKKPTKTKNNDK